MALASSAYRSLAMFIVATIFFALLFWAVESYLPGSVVLIALVLLFVIGLPTTSWFGFLPKPILLGSQLAAAGIAIYGLLGAAA